MGGMFDPVSRPALADVYFDWDAEGAAIPQVSQGQTVVIAQTADYGAVNTPVVLTDPSQIGQAFSNTSTPLSRGILGAFKGHGHGGKGGAGAVIAYRLAHSDAAKATISLQNTTPAAALRLTAKQPGTRANALKVTVQASAVIGSQDLLVLDGAQVIEKYTAVSANIASMASQINTLSRWFTATVLIDAVALALVSSSAVAGGLDGTALVGADYTAMFAALDRLTWGGIAALGVTDSAILASFVAWMQTRNSTGLRSWAIVGGLASEVLSTAITRSQGINAPEIINLGGFTLTDTLTGATISTADFTARYAGARAWRGESRDDIYVRFADVDLTAGPSLTDETFGLAAGVTMCSRDTDPTAPVFVREGVTTYADDTQSPLDLLGNKTHPVKLYKRIKNVATQIGVELEVSQWARTGNVLGEMPVDDKTRAIVLGRVQEAYQKRQDARVVQAGWSVQLDPTIPTSDNDDFVAYLHGFHPTRSLRQMLNTAVVG